MVLATPRRWRFVFILSIIYCIVSGLIWRLYTLSVLDQPFLRQQSNERVLRLLETPSMRGMFVDRNGFPLAVSTKVYSVWLNPFEFTLNKEALQTVSRLLGMPSSLLSRLSEQGLSKDREFVYLKRDLPPPLPAKLMICIFQVYTRKWATIVITQKEKRPHN